MSKENKKSLLENDAIRTAQQAEANLLYECAQEAFTSRLVRLPTFRLRAIGFTIAIGEAAEKRNADIGGGLTPNHQTEDVWDFDKASNDASFAARDAFRIVVGANRALRKANVAKEDRARVLHNSVGVLALAKLSAESHTAGTSILPSAINRLVKAPRGIAYGTRYTYPAHAFSYDTQQESLALTTPFLDWIQADREQQRAEGIASVRGCPARLMSATDTFTGPQNMLETYWHQYVDTVYAGIHSVKTT